MGNTVIGYRILITTIDDRQIYWHKNGVLHQLSLQLGPTWVAHFNKDIWLVTPQGAFVPPGADPSALAIKSVALEALTQ